MCQKMLEKDSGERYVSFHDVLDDLRVFSESGQAFATRDYGPGDVIFREGETGEFAFTIVSGSVRVSKMSGGQSTVLAELGRGEIVGELAIFTKERRSRPQSG
jgi:CRP-like cAMP-binding protein